MNRWGDSRAKLWVKHQNWDLRTVVEVIRYIETTAEITGGRWKVSWTRRRKTKEERKEKKKDIYVYVLSVNNIADALNMFIRVYSKKIDIF